MIIGERTEITRLSSSVYLRIHSSNSFGFQVIHTYFISFRSASIESTVNTLPIP